MRLSFIPRLIIRRYEDNQVFKGTAIKRYRFEWHVFGCQIRLDFDKWGMKEDIK